MLWKKVASALKGLTNVEATIGPYGYGGGLNAKQWANNANNFFKAQIKRKLSK